MASYLDGNGLLYFWQKIKNTFTVKADAIKNITRSGTTFTATRADGTTFTFTQQDNNTTYTAASATPLMDGTGAVGTSAKYAREDHVHPSDTTKVDKVSGKGLSANDYTTAEKNKLAGIAAGAEVNQNAFGKVNGVSYTDSSVTGTVEADEESDNLYFKYYNSASDNSYTHIRYKYTSSLAMGTSAGGSYTDIGSYDLSHPVFGQGYGECTTAKGTTAKVAALSDYVRMQYGIVSIKFTADVDANATLSINDCGALPIRFKGSAITAGVINAGDIATFMLIQPAMSAWYELIAKTTAEATSSVAGLMSAADKSKLTGIAAGAEVNQNAFSNVKVGSTTVAADGKTDTLELVAGSNVTLTPDATNDKVTIAATNTTYNDATTSAHGLMSATDKTKLDGIETGATKVWFGSCATYGSIAGKEVTCEGFTLTDGALVLVNFGQVNTAASITMNVNGTGALPVYIHGSCTNTPRLGGQNNYLFRYEYLSGNSRWTLTQGGSILKTGVNATYACSTITNNASRQYAVVLDKDGYLSVNVPWTTLSLSNITPKMDGTAAVGTSALVARADHVHPADTNRVPISRTVNGHELSADIILSASDVSAIPTSTKGVANGVCPLNASNKIDATYLPSYVDDVIEAYPRSGQTALSSTWLATGSATGTVITPEAGKIYVLMAASGDYAANSQFRWGGSAYVLLQSGEGISAITNAEIDTIVAS